MQAYKAAYMHDAITKAGQRFVDDPVFANPRKETTIESSIRVAFGRRMVRRIILGYERIRLKWIRPGEIKKKG